MFWLAETIFFHFLRQMSTAATKSGFFFNRNIFLSQSFIPAGENKFLTIGNSIFLFQVFHCWCKILLKFGGSQILKTNHVPANRHHFFSIFPDFF